jgi:hypothetical protein
VKKVFMASSVVVKLEVGNVYIASAGCTTGIDKPSKREEENRGECGVHYWHRQAKQARRGEQRSAMMRV